LPDPPLEGQFVMHRFGLGSSGAFGEEAPGPWLSEQQALEAYRRIFWSYRLFGDDGIFRRSRFNRPVLRTFQRWVPLASWYDTHASI
jgi:hypothetical protein